MFVLALALVAAPVEETPVETRWYGWQTLIPDGAAAAAVGLSLQQGGKPSLSSLGIALYFAGGPVVHAAHGRWGTALGDLALRTGLVGLGALLGLAASGGSQSQDVCGGCVGLAAGAVLGGLTAMTLDAAWLAHEPVEPARVQVAPAVGWMAGRNGERHASYGLLAAF